MSTHPELPPGCNLVSFESIDSTNREAKAQADAGAPDGTVVWAREQTAGRGRHGRHWSSPPGNLYLSVVFRPRCTPAQATQIGFVAGTAMAEAIEATAGLSVTLKWPNDLLHADRKLAGILLESSADADGALAWAVAGIGVNLAHHPAELPDATDLAAEGANVAVEALRDAFLVRLFARIEDWKANGFAAVRADWSAHALPAGTAISVKLPEGPVFGRFEGIDEAGNLLLNTGASVARISAGEVFPTGRSAAGGG